MLRLTFDRVDHPLRTILCIGAHCDDIEIGCGGTILKLADQYPDLKVHWVVLSSDSVRAAEAKRSAERFLEQIREKEVVIEEFRASSFPYAGERIKEYFESLKDLSPDLVFTHYRNDLHQDHRLTSELTWNTFRNQLILEYEIPKYDGDLGTPNVYTPLDEDVCRRKVRTILECFVSQRDKDWFSEDTFLGLMRLRGVESKSATRFAEAFYGRKIVL